MPLVNANGIAHNAVELGAGSPVVMLHGLLVGSSASWYFTSAPLLAQKHRLLLYDLRGHGRSAHAPSGYATRALARDLEALLAELGWNAPVALVGHSYGAVVALRYALAHPGRVSKLVLVEAPLPPTGLPELEGYVRLGAEHMAEALPEISARLSTAAAARPRSCSPACAAWPSTPRSSRRSGTRATSARRSCPPCPPRFWSTAIAPLACRRACGSRPPSRARSSPSSPAATSCTSTPAPSSPGCSSIS